MTITFKSIQGKARLQNPLKDFALDEIPYEIRYDPLTGETGRVFDLPSLNAPGHREQRHGLFPDHSQGTLYREKTGVCLSGAQRIFRGLIHGTLMPGQP